MRIGELKVYKMGCGSDCSTCPFAEIEEEMKKKMKKQAEKSEAKTEKD